MEKSRSLTFGSRNYSAFGLEDGSDSYDFNGPSGSTSGFEASGDPESKRRKRVAAYNALAKEGRLKASFRSSFRWIKSKLVDH